MMVETGKQCKARQKKQGKLLAEANKACKGTPNDKGQFYGCVSRRLQKIFKAKK